MYDTPKKKLCKAEVGLSKRKDQLILDHVCNG